MNLRWSLSINSRAECLTCPALILEKQFISNTAGRKCSIDIKPDEVHCKLQKLVVFNMQVKLLHHWIWTLTEQENQDVKFLLIIIGIFAKMQHF